MKKTLVPFMVASTLALGVMTPVGLMSPTAVEASNDSAMYSKGNVSLFATKHQQSKKLVTSIPKGQKVWVFAHEGSWSKVRVNGITGYMPKSTLTNLPLITTPANPSSSVNTGLYSVKANVNLKAGKHQTAHKTLVVIPKGSSVSFLKDHGSWAEISFKGVKGFVAKNALVASQSTPTHSVKGTVNLKAGKHQTAHKTLAVMKNGETVTLLSEQGSWVEVMYKGQKGFVAKSTLVRLANSATPTVPVNPIAHPKEITNAYLEGYLPKVASAKGKFQVGGVGDSRQVTYYFKDVVAPIVSISTGSDGKGKPFGIQVSIREVLASGISTAERTSRYNEIERITGIAIDTIYASSPQDAEVVKKEIFGLMAEQHQAIIKDRKQMMNFQKEKTIVIGKESKKMSGTGSTLLVFF